MELGGGSIAGTVLGIAPHAPAEGMSLTLYSEEGGSGSAPFVLGGQGVVSHGGTLEPSTRTAVADESGAFRFDGLLDHTYRLNCVGPAGCSVPGGTSPWLQVEPGTEDLVIQYEGPLLIVAVRGPGGPIPDARCTVRMGDFSASCPSNDDAGLVYWELAAGEGVTAVATAKGYLSQEFSVPPLRREEVAYHEVILVPAKERVLRRCI